MTSKDLAQLSAAKLDIVMQFSSENKLVGYEAKL